ncbi:TIM-barrel domain, IGPS-like protein [Kalmanozyma brasiliensis GHG001]|uniref:MEKK and related serine/threonine protein kinase n=1 Tax=Kalmanozyma brasiliensis (strain GHG001) TaxID=1365824 RepID=V5EP27_KALBG|nr:TIM-barrel domain, IGPS-like protein [Kalmanozyma brasiliensis GHG001]EST04678.1 TIM-barrel domain, IGPS-like protein [Kalmanozyma brasiliensis GHG001]
MSSYSEPPADGREAADRLRSIVKSGKPIIGSGAGIGLTAKFVEKGGADLIILYNSGRYRMAGRGSLAGLMPYGDANAIVVEMAAEVLPVISHTPVLAGVCASDPFRSIPKFLRQLKEIGFVGVQNFPTVGLIDGNFRKNLEETGMGFEREVELMQHAKQLGLLTTPYVFNTEEAEKMAKVGVDVIVAHMGLTTSGSIGAQTAMSLDDAVKLTSDITAKVHSISPEIMVLVHGGPVASASDAQYVLDRVKGLAGFYGASSMERLPVEVALEDSMKEFKGLKISAK